MIPFNIPFVPESSKRYCLDALESNHQQGDGPFTNRASAHLSSLVGGGHILLTPSCTHALEMASMLGNFAPGDEVIVPSYTFTSAATAIAQFGATPVFVDIDPITKCIDVNKVEDAISDRTVAISWVNYAGSVPDIEALQQIASKRNLLLIEDNAHGLGGSYKGKPLGSFGDFATQSFHATKNIQCGEGGALVINNHRFIDRAEVIREKGTNRVSFSRGEINKYQWIDKGSSYLLAESLAGILLGQLESFDEIQANRLSTWDIYKSILGEKLPDRRWSINTIQNLVSPSAHMFWIRSQSVPELKELKKNLESFGIGANTHYLPLHLSPAGANLGRSEGNLDVAINFSATMIRLPLWYGISKESVKEICSFVLSFIQK